MPFQKGQSGNPGGKPKDYISKRLRTRVAKDGDALADVIWTQAMQGVQWACQMVYDRTEGKVPDENRHTVEVGDTLAGVLRRALDR